jgi:hypothetical protein
LILQLSFLATAHAQTSVTVSGLVRQKQQSCFIFCKCSLKTEKDSSFVSGTVTNEEGRFTLSKIKSETII